jgi:hypothetical protein
LVGVALFCLFCNLDMELVPIRIAGGEEKAWNRLCGLAHADVCTKTGAVFSEKAGAYIIRCFGAEFYVNPRERLISSEQPGGSLFLGKLKDLFRIAVLWYMDSAINIPQTGRLLRPVDVKGGHRFSGGAYVLPLDAISAKYAKDREGFIQKGLKYGAEVLKGHGDACIRLYPLPRVPVTMLLWVEDEEFPATTNLFFDSTCEFQLALSDVVWAVAIMCSMVVLED